MGWGLDLGLVELRRWLLLALGLSFRVSRVMYMVGIRVAVRAGWGLGLGLTEIRIWLRLGLNCFF